MPQTFDVEGPLNLAKPTLPVLDADLPYDIADPPVEKTEEKKEEKKEDDAPGAAALAEPPAPECFVQTEPQL